MKHITGVKSLFEITAENITFINLEVENIQFIDKQSDLTAANLLMNQIVFSNFNILHATSIVIFETRIYKSLILDDFTFTSVNWIGFLENVIPIHEIIISNGNLENGEGITMLSEGKVDIVDIYNLNYTSSYQTIGDFAHIKDYGSVRDIDIVDTHLDSWLYIGSTSTSNGLYFSNINIQNSNAISGNAIFVSESPNCIFSDIVVDNSTITSFLSITATNVTFNDFNITNSQYGYGDSISITAFNVNIENFFANGIAFPGSATGSLLYAHTNDKMTSSIMLNNVSITNGISTAIGLPYNTESLVIKINNFGNTSISYLIFDNVFCPLLEISSSNNAEIISSSFSNIFLVYNKLIHLTKIDNLYIEDFSSSNCEVFGPFSLIQISESKGRLTNIQITDNGNPDSTSITGIGIGSSDIVITDSTFINSNAPRAGALFATQTNLTVTNSYFSLVNTFIL